MDRLQKMWDQQLDFMNLLREKRNFPEFPVDITTKQGQKFLKSITHECMGELFEANQELKNSKSHRASDLPDIDKNAYLEELVDSLHFFFEIVIASGIGLDDLVGAYLSKGQKNVERIEGGY
jgi:hypothetical protein